jgi:hypothetical protein
MSDSKWRENLTARQRYKVILLLEREGRKLEGDDALAFRLAADVLEDAAKPPPEIRLTKQNLEALDRAAEVVK